jgi:diacylglycerol kinase
MKILPQNRLFLPIKYLAMKSFKYAFNGIFKVIQTERNFKIHVIAIVLVTTIGFYFSVSQVEWLILILAFILVTVTEMINTALENVSDFVSPHYNEKIKHIKNISAGAVLLAAIGSLIIGLIIFLPYIHKLIF